MTQKWHRVVPRPPDEPEAGWEAAVCAHCGRDVWWSEKAARGHGMWFHVPEPHLTSLDHVLDMFMIGAMMGWFINHPKVKEQTDRLDSMGGSLLTALTDPPEEEA